VAKHLGLSPSAVSHALTRLRDLFDDQLFIRKPHGLEPTRRALELGPGIEALIDLAGTTLSPQSGFDPKSTECRFTISAPEFVTAVIGGPLIKGLQKTSPRASFAVQSLGHQSALDALRRGELDLALGRFGPVGYGLTVETLYEDHFCVVARKGHPRLKSSISLDAYNNTGHVIAHAASETAQNEDVQVQNWLGQIKVVATVPLWLTALALVASTDTIATCPLRLAQRQADVLDLQILKMPFPPQSFTVSAIRRADYEDQGIDWFISQIKKTTLSGSKSKSAREK
jgi:DNA-binding transcriptional LysR family regulator